MDLKPGADGAARVAAAAGAYCRAVETHLCRRNNGHLIRIVGPSFERVCGWAARGVPLKVTFAGIDRCVERHQAKARQRRPVQVDFCEADVLDAFDEWRRALGVPVAPAPSPARAVSTAPGADHAEGSSASDVRARRASLPAHLERAIARLTTARAGASAGLLVAIDATVRELDAARATAGSLRGDARRGLLGRLAELDRALVTAAVAGLAGDAHRALRQEAESELAPYRARMTPDAYAAAVAVSVDRIVREQARLPQLALP